MNIIEEIEKIKNLFETLNNEKPNCVKIGKKEISELENWYDIISKPESDNKKVKIKDGSMIMGLRIIKTKDRSFLEVANEKNIDKERI